MITLWLFNIAMENGPFIDGLPIKNGDFPWRTVKQNSSPFDSVTPLHHPSPSPLSITPLHHPSPYGIIYVFSCFRCRPAPATVFQRRVADVENAQDIQHLGILVSLTRAHIAWGMRNKQRQLTREIYGNIIAKYTKMGWTRTRHA